MTPPDAPTVRVRYADAALTALVVRAARGVTGVARLQPRSPVRALARVLPGAGTPDASAVELGRDEHGTLEVAVRLVARLEPAPRTVVAEVTRAVAAQLAIAHEPGAKLEITVTDVQR